MDTQVNPAEIALEDIDVSNPWLHQNEQAALLFERLRNEAPVHFCAESDYGPYWSITKFQDIMSVDINHDVFSSACEHGGHQLGFERLFDGNGTVAPMFLAMNPPTHDAQRKTVTPVVGPANLKEMESLIRERCGKILILFQLVKHSIGLTEFLLS